MIKWVPKCEELPDDLSPLDKLLFARGFCDQEAIDAFLHPKIEKMYEPYRMPNMRDAVELIEKCRDEGRAILVYGDYDVDGVTATALLTGFLASWGVRTKHYIPSRHDEGYGLNEKAIRRIAGDREVGLLITVDCGITSADHIALAKSLGLAAIVTDHHRPGEILPACPVLNPLLGYPYPSLCGAGVALKLCQTLDWELAVEFIDLAALGTVADVVPLTDENRVIAALGIERINERPRPGLEALMEAAGVERGQVTSGKIGFQLAPRLNAGGRVGDAGRSLRLLTANTLDEARPVAKELEAENVRRKALESAILAEAEAQLEGFDFAVKRVIVLAGESWNAGVLGLAASRLVERYNLPTVLLRREGGELHGSCRSIPGVDIYRALTAVSGFLTRFGGHSQAAGLALEDRLLPEFERALDGWIAAGADPECFVPAARYDMALPLSALDESFVRSLSLFEPTGFGNPAPVFLTEASVESSEAVGALGAHLRLRLGEGGRSLPGVAFSMGDRAERLPKSVRALYAPRISEFRRRISVECHVKALDRARYIDAFLPGSYDFDGLFQTFLTNRLYNRNYSIPPAGSYAGFDGIFERLLASPRGALVLAATEDAALAFLEAAERAAPDRMDVFPGRWPDDPRAFNALCLLPPGAPPRGYDAVFSLDAPDALWGFEALEPEAPGNAPIDFWPDLDMLRAVYVAARDLSKRPILAKNKDEIPAILAGDMSLKERRLVIASLAVLTDMNLIELKETRPWLEVPPPRKADPLESPVYQWMRRLSQWGGEPLDT